MYSVKNLFGYRLGAESIKIDEPGSNLKVQMFGRYT